jgi:hypothetical protein
MPGIESFRSESGRPTGVVRSFATQEGAAAHARRYSVNVVCEGRASATGGWVPVARLRPDQVFQRARIEESGTLVELIEPNARVISEEMERAGAGYLMAQFGQLGNEHLNWRLLAVQLYTEMESAR